MQTGTLLSRNQYTINNSTAVPSIYINKRRFTSVCPCALKSIYIIVGVRVSVCVYVMLYTANIAIKQAVHLCYFCTPIQVRGIFM